MDTQVHALSDLMTRNLDLSFPRPVDVRRRGCGWARCRLRNPQGSVTTGNPSALPPTPGGHPGLHLEEMNENDAAMRGGRDFERLVKQILTSYLPGHAGDMKAGRWYPDDVVLHEDGRIVFVQCKTGGGLVQRVRRAARDDGRWNNDFGPRCPQIIWRMHGNESSRGRCSPSYLPG